MEFEWDQEKPDSNFEKYGIQFAETAIIFFDLLSVCYSTIQYFIATSALESI